MLYVMGVSEYLHKGVGIAVSTLGNSAVLIQADTVDKSAGWASNPSLTKRLYLEV